MYKCPIRFCHFKEKTKILKLLLQFKLNIIGYKIFRCLFVVEKPLGFFSLRKLPSFNYKSNFSGFVFLAEWKNLIRPFGVDKEFQPSQNWKRKLRFQFWVYQKLKHKSLFLFWVPFPFVKDWHAKLELGSGLSMAMHKTHK